VEILDLPKWKLSCRQPGSLVGHWNWAASKLEAEFPAVHGCSGFRGGKAAPGRLAGLRL